MRRRAADGEEVAAERQGNAEVAVLESGEGRGRAKLRLIHMLEPCAGSHLLRLTCAAWVYNCAGLPIALRPADEDDARELVRHKPPRNMALP